jgi:hypothetical protein
VAKAQSVLCFIYPSVETDGNMVATIDENVFQTSQSPFLYCRWLQPTVEKSVRFLALATFFSLKVTFTQNHFKQSVKIFYTFCPFF